MRARWSAELPGAGIIAPRIRYCQGRGAGPNPLPPFPKGKGRRAMRGGVRSLAPLSLNTAHHDTTHEVALRGEEEDNRWQGHHHRGGHQEMLGWACVIRLHLE